MSVTVTSMAALKITLGPLNRWLIVLAAAQAWAWNGKRFVEYSKGIREGQPLIFDTENQALDYAREKMLEKPKVKP
jgi:hypothetical protein